MKFIHLSDLHLGKRVNEYSMLEDQEYILKKIINVVDAEKPDGVIIAGDIYDKSVPAAEAVQLFDNFLVQLAKRKLEVFVISGNSQFIEMFGSLGTDEKGWGLTTLGKCCELNPKRPKDIDDELWVSFVPMPAVSEDGRLSTSEMKQYAEVKKGFTYFAENDVLFAKITPCMENGKGCVAEGLSNGIGAGSTEFHVLRPIVGKSNPFWLYILTMHDAFRSAARQSMTGTGGQLRVPISFLDDYPITLPPVELQEEFEQMVRQSDKSKYCLQRAQASQLKYARR